MRRFWPATALIIGLAVILAVFGVRTAPAQDKHEERIAALETRVSVLETAVVDPDPTATATPEQPTPTPSPTPYVQQSEGFELADEGQTFQELLLAPGSYDLTFTCDEDTGSVRISFPFGGADRGDFTMATEETVTVTLQTATLSAETAIVLISIDCESVWRLVGVPRD